VSKPISQSEARSNRKELRKLREVMESQRRYWYRDWPCSTVIGSFDVDTVTAAKISTARMLKHAVVVTVDGVRVSLFALELGK
jgi:hypothetical protein